jgi:myosin-1
LTRSKLYIVLQHLVQKQVQVTIERSIPLGAIKFVGTSSCKDDWFSLGVGSPQDADPLLNCVLKTELFTHMQAAMPGGFNLKISDSIEYAKKPGKMQIIKVVKDSTMRDDFYKWGNSHQSG